MVTYRMHLYYNSHMKLFDNVQSGQTRDRMHPELGDPSDPSGLLEHREYCLQKIEDKMNIMMIRN